MGKAKPTQRTSMYVPASVALEAFRKTLRKTPASGLDTVAPTTDPVPPSLSGLLPPHIAHAAFNGMYFSGINARYTQAVVPLWCDMCGKEPLQACIGAKGVDLCLACVENIRRAITFLP
jgi:hypothetical protein